MLSELLDVVAAGAAFQYHAPLLHFHVQVLDTAVRPLLDQAGEFEQQCGVIHPHGGRSQPFALPFPRAALPVPWANYLYDSSRKAWNGIKANVAPETGSIRIPIISIHGLCHADLRYA